MRHSSSARLAVAIAATAVAPAALAQGAPIAGDAPVGTLADLLVVLAVVLAAAALAIALLSFARARATGRALDRLTRSMDGAVSRLLADAAGRADATAGAQEEMRHRLDTLSLRVGQSADADTDVIPLLAPRKAAAKPKSQAAARPASDELEVALASALADDTLELSLQPIVSVSGNVVKAFEAFVHLGLADGQSVDLRRPAEPSDRFDRAAFECRIVTQAVEIGRRRLGAERETLALHCPISHALLDDPRQSAAVAELLRLHPTMARAIVLSAPSPLLVDATRARRESLEPLLAAGATFAAEGWDAPLETMPALRASAVGFLKLDTDRLLDRDRTRRKSPSGFDVVSTAAECGIGVIATGVASDEDAVNLLDIGVEMMAGERFGPPRRLRAAERSEAGGFG